MRVSMFTSWQVRCGIADYSAHLVEALNSLGDVSVSVTPFDHQPHPRSDYAAWGRRMNDGDIAHIQHEYSFFGYRLPWRNYYRALVAPIDKPLVITRHVSFDGPFSIPGAGVGHLLRRVKWEMYKRWLGPYATYLNYGMFKIAGAIIVLSAHLKEHLVRRGIPADQVHVIPAGVPAVAAPAGGATLRAVWGWQDKIVIGQPGYITPAKGHLTALAALQQLPESYCLLIAGGLRREADRPALAAIEREIARSGLQSRVRITGFVPSPDLPAHIDACDALIYPHTQVDSSYSVVSGAAYQHTPLIVSDVPAHVELAGFCPGLALFPSGDAAALAHAILEVTQNQRLNQELVNGLRRYAQEFAWSAIAKRTRAVYERVLKQSGHRYAPDHAPIAS